MTAGPQIISASVQGALHRAKNIPCQDFCKAVSRDGRIIAVVSDGAGSAKYGRIGAKTVCDTLCEGLADSDIKSIREDVAASIEKARRKLLKHRLNGSKSESGLADFSATLIGFFYCGGKGMFFHIGDGAGIAYKAGEYDDFIISGPENGAYPCETFFYTMSEWRDCLRFLPAEGVNRAVLMTDGVTGFVFGEDFYRIRRNFLLPVVEYLEGRHSRSQTQNALRNTLNDGRAQRINPDDKTILWVKMP